MESIQIDKKGKEKIQEFISIRDNVDFIDYEYDIKLLEQNEQLTERLSKHIFAMVMQKADMDVLTPKENNEFEKDIEKVNAKYTTISQPQNNHFGNKNYDEYSYLNQMTLNDIYSNMLIAFEVIELHDKYYKCADLRRIADSTITSIDGIEKYQIRLQSEDKEELQKIQKELKSLLDMETTDIKAIQERLELYNEHAINIWNDYLTNINDVENDDFKYMIHSSPKMLLEPHLKCKYLSTSLITNNTMGMWSKNTGIIIKPKHIVAASYEDTYTFNGRDNEEELFNIKSPIMLPQEIEDINIQQTIETNGEMLNYDTENIYSEIVVDEYEIEAVYYTSNGEKELAQGYKAAKEMSEERGLPLIEIDKSKYRAKQGLEPMTDKEKRGLCENILNHYCELEQISVESPKLFIDNHYQEFYEKFIQLKENSEFSSGDILELFSDVYLEKNITKIDEKKSSTISENATNESVVQTTDKTRVTEEPKLTVEQSKDIETNEENREQFKKVFDINLKKNIIEEQITSIPNNLKTRYDELKQEEIKFSNLAKKIDLDYSTTKIEETNIPLGIEQIKNNMRKVNIQIQKVNDLTKLNRTIEVLQELKNLITIEIKSEYITELKKTFEKSFDNKIQDLIKNTKISKLEEEKNKIEEEKISIIGRALGKGKLKQAKIDNIDLQIQLLMSDSGNDKTNLSLEDSLSDLYAYLQYDLEKKPTPAISEFLHTIKSTPQLLEMIDKSKLGQQFNEKMNAKQYDKQLTIPNNKTSSRRQTNMLQVQNNELSQQIQNNKFNAIAKQNNLSHIVINPNNSLNKFQNIVSKINLSIQSREEKQLNRNEQENEIQL